jgi:NAD(P)-dependent dehydrogenase (short-subunit alcohol dehydrogenase family)
MAKILVTGSSGGLGLMTGRLLAEEGHRVVLHARSEARAEAVRAALPQAEAVVVGDLSTLAAMRDVADQANGQGRFDAVIHNVAIYLATARRAASRLWTPLVVSAFLCVGRFSFS